MKFERQLPLLLKRPAAPRGASDDVDADPSVVVEPSRLTMESPNGPLAILWTPGEPDGTARARIVGIELQLQEDQLSTPGEVPEVVARLAAEFAEYFEKGSPIEGFAFEDLDTSGWTPFQAQVYRAILDIPHGETRTYGWVAARVGNLSATRAVGQALRNNPLPILVPCHRVVSMTSLGGFMGHDDPQRPEVGMKKSLIGLEERYLNPDVPFRVSESASPGLERLGLGLASAIAVLGTFWAYQRGAYDFAVFHEAWRVVLTGGGANVYHATPDRYLYAPGFAWLLAPLGLFPRDVALGVWCLAKACALGLSIRGLARAMRVAPGVAAFGVVLLARVFLIDFQYGQVNGFLLAACIWALLVHFDPRSGGSRALTFIAWAALAVAAVAKLFPLPLLMIPWLPWARVGETGRDRLRMERCGAVIGVLLVALAPVVTEGLAGTWHLLSEWRLALISRGLPMESHNQSFAAVLHHYITGEPVHFIAAGWEPIQIGVSLIAPATADLLAGAWFAATTGVLLGLLLTGPRRIAPLAWMAVVIGWLIVPSHLVWKPYFVLALPAAALLARDAAAGVRGARWFAAVFFVAVNLTGFDFVGMRAGALIEASSLFLVAHLVLLARAGRAAG